MFSTAHIVYRGGVGGCAGVSATFSVPPLVLAEEGTPHCKLNNNQLLENVEYKGRIRRVVNVVGMGVGGDGGNSNNKRIRLGRALLRGVALPLKQEQIRDNNSVHVRKRSKAKSTGGDSLLTGSVSLNK